MPSITFGRWNPTEVMERRLDGDWPNPTPFATNLVIPTSVDKAGTGSTATISANGSVTFSACTSLSLNGVFTSDYDNYMVMARHTSGDRPFVYFRLRSSGTDATATNYTYQHLEASSTTVGGARGTSQAQGYIYISDDDVAQNGFVLNLYGPYLAQPTAARSISASSAYSAYILDMATTHSLSTAYDGITIYPQGYAFTGLVSVYGLGV